MSRNQTSTSIEAVFTDTCVLYDYTVDDAQEAAQLFDSHTNVRKVTSQFGYDEYLNVAERRASAYEAWESAVAAGESSAGDHRFTTPAELTERDREKLRELQTQLVDQVDQVEALRRISERRRRYEQGIKILFTSEIGDQKVEVKSNIECDDDLISRLRMDISNYSDCQLLADAVEWYASGGSDNFVTSDKDDFGAEEEQTNPSSSSGTGLPASLEELGNSGGSLQDDIDLHISMVYDSIDHIDIWQLEELVAEL